MGALEELRKIEAKSKRRLDEAESIPFLARVREEGVLNDEDWNQIAQELKNALAYLKKPSRTSRRRSTESIIDIDKDPRNAAWLRIVSAREHSGYELPNWAALWLWQIGFDKKPNAFWSPIRKVAKAMGFKPMSRDELKGGRADPIPLTKATLKSAISLLSKLFPYAEDQKWGRRNLRESLEEGATGKKYWVKTDEGGRVIGLTGLYFEPRHRREEPTGWLGWFGVHPDFRRKGVGTSMLCFTMSAARRIGCKRLKLYTSLDRNEEGARRLYERLGFQRRGVGRDTGSIYYEIGLTRRLIMARGATSSAHEIRIEWEGPLKVAKVIKEKIDEGKKPHYAGLDYGVYQIYAKHIRCGLDTLIYVGRVTGETFSDRFDDHWRLWLHKEEKVNVYLGRISGKKYTSKNNWATWYRDVELAENILIYKYSPNYNGRNVAEPPCLAPFEKVVLIHTKHKHRLDLKDIAPDDYI